MESFLLKLDANGNVNGVGIQEQENIFEQVKCYPNPAGDKLFFDIPFTKARRIEIYNAFGQLVLAKDNYENGSEVNITALKMDLYTFKIATNSTILHGKFVKN
jgi:hypothetical protein